MRSYELTCRPPISPEPDDTSCMEAIDTFLSLQQRGGWLREYQLIDLAADGTLRYLLMAWEGYDWEAVCTESHNAWQFKRLQEMGVELLLQEVGRIACREEQLAPSSALVLQGNPYQDHALLDMTTFDPVSLRCIPRDPDRSYDAYHAWKGNYNAVFHLWDSDVSGQRALRHELFDLRSRLNQAGRQVCADFEARSGIPTYYYFWRGRYGLSKKQELNFRLGVDHPEASALVLDHPHYTFINHKERLVGNVVPEHAHGFSDWVRQQGLGH